MLKQGFLFPKHKATNANLWAAASNIEQQLLSYEFVPLSKTLVPFLILTR